MSSYSPRLGGATPVDVSSSPPLTAVDPALYLAPPNDVRRFLGSTITSALAYFNTTLDTIAAYAARVLAANPASYDWAQAQFVLDRGALIAAIEQGIQERFADQLTDANMASINAKISTVNAALQKIISTLNPDVGQAAMLQKQYEIQYYAAKAAGKPAPAPLTFTPAFTTGAAPFVTAPPSPSGGGGGAGGGSSLVTLAIVGVGAFVAYSAFK